MSEPVGVVLAGGAGRRLGGDKARALLAGRPLLDHPLAAVRAVVGEVAVVAKRDTPLPPLAADVAVWRESEDAFHPLLGIAEALRRAARPVLVCPVDLPLVTPELLRALLAADAAAPAVVARGAGRLQPLLGRYAPGVLAALQAAGETARATDVIEALAPVVVDWPDEQAFLNVNDAHDLARAAGLLGAPGSAAREIARPDG